jgi:PIN domain nuclease of toxin-antitoxin system
MSALLLDTHAFIWFSENAPSLSISLKDRIESADRVYVSIASLWEIAIKISIGKLALQVDYASIEAQLPASGILLLPISFRDTVRVLNLPFHHRDPFDRILIAQAIDRSLTLVSRDEVFDAYGVPRLWV